MGATEHCYTDTHAYTIVEIRHGGKGLVLQQDKTALLNGYDSGEPDALKFYLGGFAGHTTGVQRYDIQPDPNGKLVRISLRNNGYYHRVGAKQNAERFSIGTRHEYRDFNF
jgi:hypothetical protein